MRQAKSLTCSGENWRLMAIAMSEPSRMPPVMPEVRYADAEPVMPGQDVFADKDPVLV